MIEWLTENAVTLAVCAVLVLICGAIIYAMIRNRKKGRFSCGCSCASCPVSESCPKPVSESCPKQHLK